MATVDPTAQLSHLLSIQHQLRTKKTLMEAGFFIVNETHTIFPYQTAYLFQKPLLEAPKIKAISGIAQVDRHIPLVQFLEKLIAYAIKKYIKSGSYSIHREDFPERIKQHWHDAVPNHLVFSPFINDDQQCTGGLLFVRKTSWDAQQLSQLNVLVDAYSYSWNQLTRPSTFKRWLNGLTRNKKRAAFIGVVAILIILLFPVHLTVLAPAEVVAHDPDIITAPMEGVIKTINIRPNQHVKKGQRLFSMDKTDVENAYLLAQRELDVAKAQLSKAIQKGFDHDESRSEIRVLKTQAAEKALEMQYTHTLLQRSDVKAPINGVAIFNNPLDWEGKPVATGEKVMLVANPKNAEMEVWLPVTESIQYKVGDQVVLFPNNNPLKSIDAVITQASYDAQMTPKQVLAYRIVAAFKNQRDLPRIGEQGTAKIYGQRVTFFYYLFRKPMSFLRQTLGL